MADQAPTAPAGIPSVGATDDEKLKGAVAYILGIITGVIVLLICENNKFLKFHAWQSIAYSVVLIILAVILFVITSILGMLTGGLICCIIWIPYLILIILGLYGWYGAYLIYTGKPFRMPYIADFVEKNFMK